MLRVRCACARYRYAYGSARRTKVQVWLRTWCQSATRPARSQPPSPGKSLACSDDVVTSRQSIEVGGRWTITRWKSGPGSRWSATGARSLGRTLPRADAHSPSGFPRGLASQSVRASLTERGRHPGMRAYAFSSFRPEARGRLAGWLAFSVRTEVSSFASRGATPPSAPAPFRFFDGGDPFDRRALSVSTTWMPKS